MRIGKSVWHARRISKENAEIPEYAKPIEIITRPNYFTVMPSSANGLEVLKGGENLYSSWNAIANSKYFELKTEFILGRSVLGTGKVFAKRQNFGDFMIKAGDLMWVDGERPIESIEEKYGYGASANAEVKSALEVNHTIAIKLERRQDQVK